MKGTWGWLDSQGFGDGLFNVICSQNLIDSITGPNPTNLALVSYLFITIQQF
jgi:hypothetical protein